MADINILAKKIIKLEGGFSNDPNDSGGETNMGITISTWKKHGKDKNGDGLIDSKDLKLLDNNNFLKILKMYWDDCKADFIKNQSVANLLVDFAFNSGSITAIRRIQKIVATPSDGIIGPESIAAINEANQELLFNKLLEARIVCYAEIVHKNSSQLKFFIGWLNRVYSFTYEN